MRTPTASPSSMRCGWSAANFRLSPLFPPRHKKAFHDRAIEEILQERVVSSRSRRNPRAVKRKMGNFPVRRRGDTPPPPFDIVKAIRVLK